ncbi:hypothetical protein SEA_LILMAC1015_70 [Arthrobacter phage Lilmac1015]|uniref:Uncharacterized protein n=1 Tax=Arthrobacter phage Lilmac1015 TaxID=2912653 RepID=A0AA49BPN7_9CAUD|nr:hypothetical protein SEA_LILMAC1015_70 [Arthrobacter phage Lilmac1015]
MRIGPDPEATGQVERILLAHSCGGVFPISGDKIARTRAGLGPRGLVGVVDWKAEALEDS